MVPDRSPATEALGTDANPVHLVYMVLRDRSYSPQGTVNVGAASKRVCPLTSEQTCAEMHVSFVTPELCQDADGISQKRYEAL